MPTPVFTLRLPQKTRDDLTELAKVYGAPNPRAFAREILEVVTSGDTARIQAFNRRLIMGMGEQLALKLNEPLKLIEPKPPKKKGGGRGRRKRG